MKGRQIAKVILNGTWYVQRPSTGWYIVYHEFYEDDCCKGKKHTRKKAVFGSVQDAIRYIATHWFEDCNY